MTRDAATQDELDTLEQLIDKWLEAQRRELPILRDVLRDDEVPRRWYVRLEGETRDEIRDLLPPRARKQQRTVF